MNHVNNNSVLLYIKDNRANWIPVTEQTQKIRDNTNQQIRQLGKKYYIIKSILEKMNIKRDDLFYFGKKLEEEYKDIKNGIHLKNQNKRMKESLYCWFTEYFFNEFFEYNSKLLQGLSEISKNPKIISTLQNSSLFISQVPFQDKKEPFGNKNANLNITQDKPEYKIINFNGTSINQEIDTFDNSNINNEINDEKKSSYSSNFDYAKLLNFEV